MKINELEILKLEMMRNHAANIKAIDRLLGKMRESTTTSPLQLVLFKPAVKAEMVEQIIKNTPEEFCIFDIRLKLEKEIEKRGGYLNPSGVTANRNIVSQVINKLRHRDPPEIEVVEAGRGSRSGIYKRRDN